MNLIKSTGIALQTLKFKDYDQILTLFTKEEGLIKLLIKRAYSSKQRGMTIDLLSEGEYLYAAGRNGLALCQERSILNANFHLRKSLKCLEGACAMAKALLISQMEQKPAPQMYGLLACYLKRLKSSDEVSLLASSFLLKLLRHDGLLGLAPHCTICRCQLSNYFIARGESYCPDHQPEQALFFSPFEAESLFKLAYSRSFDLIEKCFFTEQLFQKIEQLFKECQQ